MEYLNKKDALLELICEVKHSVLKYICILTDELFDDEKISKETCRWIKNQMKANKVPIEFHGNNWRGNIGEALWTWKEREMRVKYLEHLIEKL